MHDELKLFRQASLGAEHIVAGIAVSHPTLGAICDFGEKEYYSMVTGLTARASDYKVALHDIGVDYTTLSDFEFFIMMSQGLKKEMTSLILGDLDLSLLTPGKNTDSDELVLCADVDGETKVIIDRAVHFQLVAYIRKMHGLETRPEGPPSNEDTRLYLIEKERKRLKRLQKTPPKSMLKTLILSMVCQPGFKYNHETVWDLPINVFNDCITRVQKFISYSQLMMGAYTGNIDISKTPKADLNWME